MSTTLTTLAIAGMTCGSCAHHIDEALRAVPGVSRVTVNRKAQHAEIMHEANVTPATLIAATVDAGYEATQVTEAAT